MKTISTYGASLIDAMGDDDAVVDAARVSFDKIASNYSLEQNEKLIWFLAREGHWSPFSHCYLKFRVKAPLFVARQCQKHTVGLAWNEVSRRYVDSEPEFYVPEMWRARAEDVKQGSSDEAVDLLGYQGFRRRTPQEALDRLMEHAYDTYSEMIEEGVAPEMARMVLPQSTMTEWIWSGSLYAFARVCKERLHPSAQRETRWVAEDIAEALAEKFPVSWQALGPKD